MNWLDIFIIVLVVGGGFMGWRNGLIRLAVTVAGGLVGVFLAGQLYDDFAPAMAFTDNAAFQKVAAFAAVFLAVLVAAWVVGWLLRTVLRALMLGFVDNIGGLAVGVVGGAIAAGAIIAAFGSLPVASLQTAVEGSTLAEPVVNATSFVRGLLPSEFDAVRTLLDRVPIPRVP